VRLRLESGDEKVFECVRATRHGDEIRVRLPVEAPLPLGYHDVTVSCGPRTFRSRILAAPRRAMVEPLARAWGAFMPLHAFGDPARGAGTYAELRRAARFIGERGGGFVGTLPLLASFLDAPFEPSPYAPASRLFWNELFVDERELPVPAAQPAFPPAGAFVDYAAIAAAKRPVLEDAAARFFAAGGEDDPGFRAFAAENPRLQDYALFRAACDRFRAGWPTWPEPQREGRIVHADVERRHFDYHRFAAWCADVQLARLAADDSAGLYLDLPLGVHTDGYDVWRERALFAREASAGAPPDALFGGGQDWGFPPMAPDALRASGYAYLVESIRHHLRRADMLRLDHVMSLQRLYWIPRGMPASDGVYVRYPLDEMVAVITIESARHRAAVIGEDLGTVSREMRTAMRQHAVQRMYVVQYEVNPDEDPPLHPVPRDVVASLNTHDMPPFAAFWAGLDIDDQRDLGLVDEDQERAARAARRKLRRRLAELLRLPGDDPADAAPALRTLLLHLADSPARFVLVNLEDLWLETRSQNVPGTSSERPNWRRRARHSIEQLVRDPRITGLLDDIAQLRAAPRPPSSNEESHA
jgi:4-alpha-glucanotransferase